MRSVIRSNSLRIAILVWFAGWLIFVMPGHKRGIVKVPGAEAAVAGDASCCKPEPSCCQPSGAADGPIDSQQPDDDRRRPDPAKHCAICFLKAHLTDPPPVTLYTPYLGELDELAFHVESSIAQGQGAPERLRGRAPPA